MIEQISIFELLEPCESRFTSECRYGSGFEGGKVRIYLASLNMNVKELAAFLKNEYGVGGHSADFPDGGRGFADHNASGITICEWKSNVTEKHTWPEVAKEIKRLIAMNDYLSAKELAKVNEVAEYFGNLPVPHPRMRVIPA
jgi:hypothetical protein